MRLTTRWIAGAAGLYAFAAIATAATAADGKEVFLAQKCNVCHAVSTAGIEATTKSEKMKGPDLVGTIQAHGADTMVKYLKKEVDLNGKKHPKEMKATDEEIQAMIAFLEAQKK